MNRSVTCNDGSPAGYYLRKSYGSKKWLVYLEGGWYCYNEPSCRARWASSSRLMSSTEWPKTKTGSGVLSADPEENRVWWKANVVYIPYCSSDVWSGTASASDTGSYAFMGALIIQEVLQELMSVGLMSAKEMVLAGSSAGGTAVLMNLDRISEFMAAAGSKARVLGLADSGWFLETPQIVSQQTDCSNAFYCNPSVAIQMGTKLWNSNVPKSCRESYSVNERWRCFFGFRIYESIKSPIFLFQWLYDEAQLTVGSGMASPPINLQHWNFMQKTGRDMRASLRNASVVFAPACYSHLVLTTSEWTQIQVRNVKLHKALRCWLKSQKALALEKDEEETSTEIPQSNGNTHTIFPPMLKPAEEMRAYDHDEDSMLMSDGSQYDLEMDGLGSSVFHDEWDDDEDDFRAQDDGTMATATLDENAQAQTQDPGQAWWWPWKRSSDSTVKAQKKNRRKKSRRSSSRRQSNSRRQTNLQGDEPDRRNSGKLKCQFRLVDHATCPHCNPTCPKLTNPFTGEDMEFLSFMRLFGLDLGAIAAQMGLDEQSLALLDPAAAMELLAAAVRGP
ncbi:palmitoleoyl-protein carboxylesterase notum1-like isoform X2 [Amphiura filiformis]|uniref:palmitoleoyl-protein carboxylesterase notum1-like isoform X2 n=1 Tax=Amphiura filiformis TaxID=82378 RepID=UPI003B20C0EC